MSSGCVAVKDSMWEDLNSRVKVENVILLRPANKLRMSLETLSRLTSRVVYARESLKVRLIYFEGTYVECCLGRG